jgi:exosortase
VESSGKAPTATAVRPWLCWLPAALGLAGLLVLLYGPISAWMVDRWLRDPFYGHGFLVPAVSAFIAWRRWRHLRPDAAGASAWGLGAIGAAIVLNLGARALGIHFLEALSLVPMLWGIVAWVWGRQVATVLAFPIGFLAFMVPLSRMLIEFVALPLQLLSSWAAGSLLAVLGVPVFVQGVDIRVPEFAFEIDLPCSGLQSVISMTALAALFAYVVRGRLWARLTLFALSVPIALAANIGRIAIVLLVAVCISGEAATGFFHGASSVLVFLLAAMGLLGVGRLLGCAAIRDDL